MEDASFKTNLLVFWKISKPIRRILRQFPPAMDRIGVRPATPSSLRQLKDVGLPNRWR